MPREKQIGVTLTPYVKQKLEKVASIKMCSKSKVCAEAIEMYLDAIIAEVKAQQQHSTIFSALKRKRNVETKTKRERETA